jgi:hypothetical protein
MPENKYSFAPSNGEFKGGRTFAQQVKPVAAVTDSIQSKADILSISERFLAYAHKAVATVNESNLVTRVKNPFGEQATVTRLGLATPFQWHAFDHCGQMVEYLPMNGIIPPASR